jgi:hypothetical protein
MLFDLVDEITEELLVLLSVHLHLLVEGALGGSDEVLSLLVPLLGRLLNSAHLGLELAQLGGLERLQPKAQPVSTRVMQTKGGHKPCASPRQPTSSQ